MERAGPDAFERVGRKHMPLEGGRPSPGGIVVGAERRQSRRQQRRHRPERRASVERAAFDRLQRVGQGDGDEAFVSVERELADGLERGRGAVEAGQEVAVLEPAVGDRNESVRKDRLQQPGTVLERIVADRRDRVREEERRNVRAVLERVIADAPQTIGAHHACDTTRVTERAVSYHFNSVGNDNVRLA